MKFCPVVAEICHGQIHVPKKERRRKRIIIIIIRNGAKTISLPKLFGRLRHSDRSPFCVVKIFKMSAIFKMAAKTRHKNWG
jgi:hypothetical protein